MIAGEGWPWLIVLVLACALVAWTLGPLWAAPFAIPLLLLFLLFRDPARDVPPLPLAIVAPIDGRIREIVRNAGRLNSGDWTKISIRTNHFGAYTVRSPIEGLICNVRSELDTVPPDLPGGLWVRSEEGDDVVLLFPNGGGFLSPKTFIRYGERLGQGQRFAYLRLAREAEIYLPASAELQVRQGEKVRAGCDVLATLQAR